MLKNPYSKAFHTLTPYLITSSILSKCEIHNIALESNEVIKMSQEGGLNYDFANLS